MWNQRSKSDWLRYGDQNAKYFHCRAIERNKINFIYGIENVVGDWIKEESQVGDILLSFYSNLFSSANPTQFEPVLSGVQLFNRWILVHLLDLMVFPLCFTKNIGMKWVVRSLKLF